MTEIHSFEARIQRSRRKREIIADLINRSAGSFFFFSIHVVIFVVWIVLNTHLIPNFPTFDPYPFNFLTMTVSLEAIFLSIFVLMSQNRQSQIASLREEIHLQINEIAEREITKVLKLTWDMHQKLVPNSKHDPELQEMLENLDTSKIEATIERELDPRRKISLNT